MLRFIIVISAVLAAGTVHAQSDYIGIFTDGSYDNCEFSDDSPDTLTAYVVHKNMPFSTGSRASRFQVRSGGGFTGTWISEQVASYAWYSDPLAIGNSQDGVAVAYILCLPSPILIVTVKYWCVGTSPPCSYLEVVPDPKSINDSIESVDCDYNLVLSTEGRRLYFNSDGTCDCAEGISTATESTTWGRVKALYR